MLVYLDRSELPSDYVVIAISFDGRKVGRSSLRANLAKQHSPESYRSHFYTSTVHRVSSVLSYRGNRIMFYFPMLKDLTLESNGSSHSDLTSVSLPQLNESTRSGRLLPQALLSRAVVRRSLACL